MVFAQAISTEWPDWWAPAAAVAVVAVLALLLGMALGAMVRRPRAQSTAPPPDEEPSVDVSELSPPPLHLAQPRLEVYGLPVTVAVVAVAPLGRDAPVPPKRVAFHILESITPGFGEVLVGHQPRLQAWPPQLSAEGFASKFFRNHPLPSGDGKGTPWCAAAGKATWKGKHYLVGALFCAAQPSELGQRVITHAGEWLDMLRLRRDAL